MKRRLLSLGLAVWWGAASPVSLWAQPAPASTQPEVTVDLDTEKLIEGGLRFLASKQSPGGSWSGQNNNHQAAITAYVLMSFLASGNLPGEGPHGKTVQRGLEFLLDCVRPDGYIAAPTGEHNMYGHGIATVVLGEVYGMAGKSDTRIKPALERAVRLIVQTQNDQGGWRYQPRKADADVSVTVLQATALRVAKNSGIDVPQATIDRAADYVRSCFDERSGGFTYQSNAGRGGTPGFARTCAAIYTLQVLGFYDDPMVRRGSSYAVAEFSRQREWFTYGNFYGAPAHYMIGGQVWADYYREFKKVVVPRARVTGDQVFWAPIDGGNGQNESFSTAVYVTVLALPYQYVPLYQR